ncbi:unnamed protein product [Rhizophagus irregularis]|nr:unnamed protein product [Rhizophagus irregularis]CAB5366278.1 unnamed protein product [Rhizophagus irregularis]
MPLPSLPDECFNNVLSFLNRCTLHKCLLVNRYYCKHSIPIIWRNPFKWSCINGFLLINTLLKCLNEDEISSLIPYGINISHQPPLFEYEKFVRKFDHCNCVIGILEWLKFELIVLPTFQQDIIIQKLIDIIYHMFMRARSNLKEFVIFMDYGSYDLPNISTFTTYNPGITNLRSLKLEIISYSIKSQNIIEFLRTLSKVCNGIIRFKIWLLQIRNEILLPILDIIKSQPINNLSICYTITHNIEDISKTIIYTSKFRSKTLKRLTFDRISFKGVDFLLISKLKNLEYLKMFYCNNFTIKHCEDLSKREFHLKGLTWLHNTDNYDLLQVIVMINSLCDEALVELYSNVATIETVKIMKKSCPNINILRLSGSLYHLIIPLICDLTPLKTLDILVEIEVDNQVLLKSLGDYLKSVENLSFNFDFYCINLLKYFEYFTNNCKANLKKLSINLHNNNLSRKDFLKCIDNYQRVHNSLKILEIKQHEFYWSKEEREIIRSLENQGVCLKKLGD